MHHFLGEQLIHQEYSSEMIGHELTVGGGLHIMKTSFLHHTVIHSSLTGSNFGPDNNNWNVYVIK